MHYIVCEIRGFTTQILKSEFCPWSDFQSIKNDDMGYFVRVTPILPPRSTILYTFDTSEIMLSGRSNRTYQPTNPH